MTKEKMLLGDELFRHKQCILSGMTEAKRGFLEAGKHLMIIKQKRLYLADGNHAISFVYWVENELGYSKSLAYQLIDVYDKWGDLLERPEFAQIDYTRACLLLPLVTDKTTLSEKEDLLHMAAHQSSRGLKDNIKNLKGEIGTDECTHPEADQESWNKCKACGKFWR